MCSPAASTSAPRCQSSATSPGSGDDLGQCPELARGALQLAAAAGVDDERPVALGERTGESEAEASRASSDDC